MSAHVRTINGSNKASTLAKQLEKAYGDSNPFQRDANTHTHTHTHTKVDGKKSRQANLEVSSLLLDLAGSRRFNLTHFHTGLDLGDAALWKEPRRKISPFTAQVAMNSRDLLAFLCEIPFDLCDGRDVRLQSLGLLSERLVES